MECQPTASAVASVKSRLPGPSCFDSYRRLASSGAVTSIFSTEIASTSIFSH
jgi:hypothetical protein